MQIPSKMEGLATLDEFLAALGPSVGWINQVDKYCSAVLKPDTVYCTVVLRSSLEIDKKKGFCRSSEGTKWASMFTENFKLK